MRNLFRFLLLLVTVFLLLFAAVAAAKKKTKPKSKLPACTQGTAFRKCVACGSAKTQAFRDLNVLKNRDDAATNTQEVTVAEIRKEANDSGHFNPNQQVSLTAFVASLDKSGFEESCNCGRSDLRDIHINVVASETEKKDKTKFVVVEITPRWEEKFGMNRSDYDAMLESVKTQIEHKWVKFEGWIARHRPPDRVKDYRRQRHSRLHGEKRGAEAVHLARDGLGSSSSHKVLGGYWTVKKEEVSRTVMMLASVCHNKIS